MNKGELRSFLLSGWPELSPDSVEKVEKFYDLLVAENKVQNLTRLIEPHDFFFGHVLDVKELLNSGLLSFPALDLGSGSGVPGLLAALVDKRPWILAEAEGRKADFLNRAVEVCDVADHVRVFKGRAEEYLKNSEVDTVVARAVGPVGRIFGWIGRCSTWNKLVLLKGPGWNEEWRAFKLSRDRNKLELRSSHEYTVGPEEKKRIIVALNRKR